MFTGIIAAVGKIGAVISRGGDMRIKVATDKLDLTDINLGDSIAINGVCLTVVEKSTSSLSFDVSRESLGRTSLGSVAVGSRVNLEKALAVGDRLGGHFVSGHVDGLGKILSLSTVARSVIFKIEMPADLGRFVAEKGSICIDGVSLTVNKVEKNWFEVNVIPHTLQETIIDSYQAGTVINLEVDLIARYLERLIPIETSALTKETLMQNGFINP